MFTGGSRDVPFLSPLNDLSLIVFVNLEKKRKKYVIEKFVSGDPYRENGAI